MILETDKGLSEQCPKQAIKDTKRNESRYSPAKGDERLSIIFPANSFAPKERCAKYHH
jgi:hypothetical protein